MESKSQTGSKGFKMKILLLGNVNSVHIIKWAKSLALNGIDIFIFSLNKYVVNDYKNIKNIEIYCLDEDITHNEGALSKVKYLKALPKLKSVIDEYKPDILHAHYATSYGLLGALSGFHPFILSVWGLDIFSFPKKSFLHKLILKYNLSKADKILSTSQVMAKETKLYTNKDIEVTPFGIDMEQFKPMNTKEELFDKDDIVIGTVKTLEEKYGIEYLIKAFKILIDKYKDLSLKLLIVGGGSLDNSLKDLVKKLKIENKTIFVGKVPFNEVPKYQNILDIAVFPSIENSESFGVAVIEASACEKPVIVSNVGGLPEVVENGISGFVVPPKNEKALAQTIEELILHEDMRNKMGQEGRKRVNKLYNWEDNVKQMIKIYKEFA